MQGLEELTRSRKRGRCGFECSAAAHKPNLAFLLQHCALYLAGGPTSAALKILKHHIHQDQGRSGINLRPIRATTSQAMFNSSASSTLLFVLFRAQISQSKGPPHQRDHRVTLGHATQPGMRQVHAVSPRPVRPTVLVGGDLWALATAPGREAYNFPWLMIRERLLHAIRSMFPPHQRIHPAGSTTSSPAVSCAPAAHSFRRKRLRAFIQTANAPGLQVHRSWSNGRLV